MTANEKAFLIGLERLSRETGIVIDGCGCCGSPRMKAVSDMPPEAGYAFGAGQCDVAWVSPDDAYDWEHDSQKIVKGDRFLGAADAEGRE